MGFGMDWHECYFKRLVTVAKILLKVWYRTAISVQKEGNCLVIDNYLVCSSLVKTSFHDSQNSLVAYSFSCRIFPV